ncbi:adhesion G protein-coupled receptor F5-like [Trichomycterus rosablanca]|uniref:adhesion G protein-coupled receptor F5-like n=1 Tax=Trichomycterus rosablanca TaxID=2290929 RepID=UPI002F360999
MAITVTSSAQQYTVELEVNVSEEALLELLKSYLNAFINQTSTNISAVDITTVCQLNKAEYQCKCGAQYFWPCNKCVKYGLCDTITNSTCGCINAVPSDGEFCQPLNNLSVIRTLLPSSKSTLAPCAVAHFTEKSPCGNEGMYRVFLRVTVHLRPLLSMRHTCASPLPSAKPNVRLPSASSMLWLSGLNVLSKVLNRLLSFNMWDVAPVSTISPFPSICRCCAGLQVSSVSARNVTSSPASPCVPIRLPLLAARPPLPSAAARAFRTLSPIISATGSASSDASKFRSLALNSASFISAELWVTISVNGLYFSGSPLIIIAIIRPSLGASPAPLSAVKICSARIMYSVTVSLSAFFSEVNVIPKLTLSSNGANAQYASAFSSSSWARSSAVSGPGDTQIKLSLKINENFDITLTNPASKKYLQYKTDILKAIDDSYRIMAGYKSDSVVFFRFRPGSVIADFGINTTKDELNFTLANSQLSTQLTTNGYPVVKEAFDQSGPGSGCIKYSYTVEKQDCDTGAKNMTFICQLSDVTLRSLSYGSKSITIATTKEKFTCSNSEFGIGRVNDKVFKQCEGDVVGIQQAQCDSTGDWKRIFSNCTLRVIQDLADQAKNLDVRDIPQFAANLSAAVIGNARNITMVNENLLKVVDLLSTIASVAKTLMINKEVMTDFLNTVDIIASQEAQETWKNLNKDGIDQNMCSVFLQSIETIGSSLSDENCNITTPNIQLKRTSFDHSFNALFLSNISTEVGIPATPNNITHLITLIVFSALNNVLPVRNATYNDSIQTGTSINGDVILINTEPKITNISLSYGVKNESLSNPQCVFWNFDLLNGIGAWDSTGCELKPIKNQTEYTCECNHTTSFSILMSPFFPDNDALAIISYIGVGISIISLILCLIIESIIWKSVTRNDMSYMRHISIVNIALSLLIADICFIIGASLVKKGEKTPVGPCSAVTFFIHFFYLALFFWMLLSALLLLHHIIMVFSRMSKARMMAIAFTVGYGAPLIIAVITVASTAGYEGYIHERNSCWLNWDKTKALLAFVVPALTIVVINLVVLLVVLNKIMRRGIGATTLPSEKHIIVVLARCVAILTPLFGLTWGFGIGTMVSSDFGIHVVFAFLNSLQGFFVLVFGTLMDHKIYEALAGKLRLRSISSNFTEVKTDIIPFYLCVL